MPHAEANTYHLPRGEPIRRALRDVFRAQRREVLGLLAHGRKDDGPGLPVEWPRLRLGALAMSERMTPLIEGLWDESGRNTMARLDLDPDRWEVVNPHTQAMIRHAALSFCESTNHTTSLHLGEALRRTREELIAGVVTRGESVRDLTKRVNRVFDGAETWRARRIAQTEASRAVHAAQEEAAKQSGVVAGFKWLLSSDACPWCQTVARRAPQVRLGGAFAVIGDNPDYSTVKFPPLHPHCACTVQEVLKQHISGEPEPEWAQALTQPRPEAQDYPDGKIPEPKPAPGKPEAGVPTGRARRAARVAVVGLGTGLAVYRTVRRIRRLRRALAAAAEAVETVQAVVDRGMDAIAPGKIADRLASYQASKQGRRKLDALGKIDDAYHQAGEDLARARLHAEQAVQAVPRGSRATDPMVVAAERAIQDLERAHQAHEQERARVRADVIGALEVPLAARATLDAFIGKSQPHKSEIGEAQEFLGSVLASDPAHPEGLKLRYGVARGQDEQGKPARSYYEQAKKRSHLAADAGVNDVVHEQGHALEFQWRNVQALANEFLEYRCGSEPVVKLRALFPKLGFGSDEEGRKDLFDRTFSLLESYYVGRDYRTRVHQPGQAYPTEIVSMGIEMLLKDPVRFARNDPEYCSLILGILDGSIR